MLDLKNKPLYFSTKVLNKCHWLHCGLLVPSGTWNLIIQRSSILNLMELRPFPFVPGSTEAKLPEPPPYPSQSSFTQDKGVKCCYSARSIYWWTAFFCCLGTVGFRFHPLVENKLWMMVGGRWGRGRFPSICLVYGGDMRAPGYCSSSWPQWLQWCGQGFNQLHLPAASLPLALQLGSSPSHFSSLYPGLHWLQTLPHWLLRPLRQTPRLDIQTVVFHLLFVSVNAAGAIWSAPGLSISNAGWQPRRAHKKDV